ncbi:hypothetical protein KSS87_017993 [Heliosperma pusillum]|nr:hypothetical protein KSS87_017993 [Heliosperma pusillum]
MTLRCDEHSDLKASDTHRGTVKKSSKKACLKCNESGGVLVCSNDDCPIVVHKECMSCAAHFDGEGNFYCPYCAYKRSLGEYHKAKECAISSKKALASFLNTKAVRSTGDVQTDVSGFTSREDILQNGSSMKMDVPKKPDEIGGSHGGGVREGTIDLRSLNDDLNLVTDNVIPVRLNSESVKRQKTAVELEELDVQRKQTERETNGSTVCSARNDAMDIDESSDKTDTATLQDEYTSFEDLKVNSEVADQSVEIQRGKCDDAKKFRSPEHDACHAGKHDASATLKESGVFLEKHMETNNVDKVYHEEMVEKDQQPVEASTRRDVNKTSVMSDVNANRVTVNSEIAAIEEHASCRRRKCNESMTHTEAVNMASGNQQNKNAMDGHYSGLAEKVHKQSEPREPTEVMNNEAGNISEGHTAVNKNIADQTSDIRVSHSKRANEGVKQVTLQKNDLNFVSKENQGLLRKKLDAGDEIKPYEENNRGGNRLRCKRKTHISAHPEIGTQPSKSPRYCESDLEDDEEATQVKSRKKVDPLKQVQHQHPPVFIGRRKKLLWTEEEEEMLKEGVDKFSLTAKKNMPWIKILEYGSHIFDGTRTPDDLKDKWKRILAKAHANAT